MFRFAKVLLWKPRMLRGGGFGSQQNTLFLRRQTCMFTRVAIALGVA